ncbi:MAG TPA: hypothetical protein VLG16_05680 [Candidatus Saccharimonadales bacterium]|nr:hypothetical protein [Candidatus Saccharimonadales bacterium]
MQPTKEGVLLETREANILSLVGGRQAGDAASGILSYEEAATAYEILEKRWDTLPAGEERDNLHNLVQELGIAMMRFNVWRRPETRGLVDARQIGDVEASTISKPEAAELLASILQASRSEIPQAA